MILLMIASAACIYAAGKIEGERGDMYTAPTAAQQKSKSLLFAGLSLGACAIFAALNLEALASFLQ